jgi:hypothetical protein
MHYFRQRELLEISSEAYVLLDRFKKAGDEGILWSSFTDEEKILVKKKLLYYDLLKVKYTGNISRLVYNDDIWEECEPNGTVE